ncbi:MAG: LysM peptidoglycan-binding domain-containing protein, partial [Streptococcus sp.]
MKIQSMKGTIATLATAATLFISGVVANADTYTVKAGDTLSEIAEDKSTTVEKLVELNHIQNPDLIFVDQVLELGDVKANQASKAATKPSAAPTAQSNSVVPATPAPATDVATPNYSNYSSGVVLENGNTP